MGNVFKRDLQNSSEFNTLVHRISSNSDKLLNNYVVGETEMFEILDEIQADLTNLRNLVGMPKEDKPDNLDESPFLHNSNVSPKAVFHYDGDMTYEQDLTDTGTGFGHYSKSDNTPKGSVKNLRAVRPDGTFVVKGDMLPKHGKDGIEDDGVWTFESITHPRKLNVYQDYDPNGAPFYPNRSERTFYPTVLGLGIWDIQYEEWSFEPNWDDSVTTFVMANLTKPLPKQ